MGKFSDFVTANETSDVQKLLLSKSRQGLDLDGFSLAQAVNTILVRRKMKTKMPSWYACPSLVYPVLLSGEQCSSEFAAMFKARLCRRIYDEDTGTAGMVFRVADLTGGLGADSWAFSKYALEVLYNEMNPELADAVRHNFSVLGVDNVRIGNSMLIPSSVAGEVYFAGSAAKTAGEILGNFSPDFIFLDPARRDGAGKKVFLLEECTPDVLKLKVELLSAARYLLVKLSPMADIGMVLERMGQGCREIHALSYGGDCRELLLLVDREWKGECAFIASVPEGSLEFSHEELKSSMPSFAGSLQDLRAGAVLFEPGKSLMKVGAFNALCGRFSLRKLGRSTHYYIVGQDSPADELSPFGKFYEIEEVMPLNNRTLKETGKRLQHADVTARNIPVDSETMMKKMNFPAKSHARADGRHVFGLRCEFGGGVSGNYLFITHRYGV